MPIDQIEHSTQLVVSSGFLAVVGGVVVIFLGGILGVVLWAGRKTVSQQQAQQVALFAWQQELVGKLVGRVLNGNGDPDSPGLRQIGQKVDSLDCRQTEFAESTVESFRLGNERMERIEGGLVEVREALGSRPCINGMDADACPVPGAVTGAPR